MRWIENSDDLRQSDKAHQQARIHAKPTQFPQKCLQLRNHTFLRVLAHSSRSRVNKRLANKSTMLHFIETECSDATATDVSSQKPTKKCEQHHDP